MQIHCSKLLITYLLSETVSKELLLLKKQHAMIARIRISTRVTKSLMNASLLWVTEAVNETIQHFACTSNKKSWWKNLQIWNAEIYIKCFIQFICCLKMFCMTLGLRLYELWNILGYFYLILPHNSIVKMSLLKPDLDLKKVVE